MRTKRLGMLVLSAMLLLVLGLLVGCGGDDNDDGGGNGDLSREGGGCAKTADCEDGLRCVDQECVQDKGSSDGDTPDGDTTDGDTTTDDHGLTWVSIPGGSFEMGCSLDDEECFDDEIPRHTVNVPSFEMTKYEVTNTQYAAFLNDRGNNNCADYPCVRVNADDEDPRLSESGGSWSVYAGYENHPVANLTWYGAKAFCDASGGRLPSEAEWEYAARAGTTTKYYCGDDSSCLDNIACWNKGDTCPVGQHEPNDFGLYDMLGGVFEWVEDCYHGNYAGAPTDGSEWNDGQCSDRVLRGGCWVISYDGGGRLRASYRDEIDPGVTFDETLGFRCARD